MSTPAKATALPTCPIIMSDGQPCGRPIHPAPPGVDPKPVCLMHSCDPEKDKALFRQEIDAILAGKSIYNRPKDTLDFTRFVFPEANFRGATFTRNAHFNFAMFTQNSHFNFATFTHDAYFTDATFTQNADFTGAKFTQNAHFFNATFTQDADFSIARFTQNADFSRARFTQNALFSGATFTQNADFIFATFTQNANFIFATFTQNAEFRFARFHGVTDFRTTSFAQLARVLFYQVNTAKDDPELRVRLVGCPVEGVRFEDVNWYHPKGRLLLQDELDLGTAEGETHELVADAYRRLVNNFEENRQYELAEECVIGEMEMRRCDSKHFLLASWAEKEKRPRWKFWRPLQCVIGKKLKRWYETSTIGRWLGEHLSFLYAYRALSMYGSSYSRALAWLLGFIFLLFPVILSSFGLRMAEASARQLTKLQPPALAIPQPVISWRNAWRAEARSREIWQTYKAGLWLSLEVATFQRERTIEPVDERGRRAAIAEIVAVPGQLTLFLFALRRRFRR